MALWTGCGKEEPPAKPELPKIAAPGWTLGAYQAAPPPAGVPAPTQCWKAEYTGKLSATILVCGYGTTGSAFDAAQRAPTGANTVKFDEGRYLVIASCLALSDPAGRDDFKSLVRAVQAKLRPTTK